MTQDDSWFEAFLRDIDNANGPTDFDEFARTIQQDATDIEVSIWHQTQEQQDQVMTNIADEPPSIESESSNDAVNPLTGIPSTFSTRQQLPFGQRPPEGQEGLYEYRSLFADMAPAPQRETSVQATYAVDTTCTPLPSIPVPPRQESTDAQFVTLANHDQSEYGWIFADQAPNAQHEPLVETNQPSAQTPFVQSPSTLDRTELALLQAFSRPLPITPEPAQPSPSATESARPPRSDPVSMQQALEATNLINGTWNISVRIVLQELKKLPRFSDNIECAKVLRKIWPDQFPDPMTDANFRKTVPLISVEQVNVEGKRWELIDLVGEAHEWRVQVREMLRGMGIV